jgi:hypothetical protein
MIKHSFKENYQMFYICNDKNGVLKSRVTSRRWIVAPRSGGAPPASNDKRQRYAGERCACQFR